MSIDASQPDRRTLLQNALAAVEKMQSKLDAYEQSKREPVAIIGMSCRFPGGANTPEAYWQLLHNGIDAVTEIPSSRQNLQEYIHSAGGNVTWHGGFVDGIDRFDPHFFGLAPREAMRMDPQQRMVLEVSWEALERAGQAPDKLRGSRTGIFIGITTNDYGQLMLSADPSELDAYTATGGALNVAPGRVAYTLGFQGPSMAIDTACSSSLVAVHLACQSLRNGESDLALAGGVNVLLSPEIFVCFNRWGMMSSDGRCKTFDARADGFVRGEGCGIIVLKRLSDAVANGDNILALIRGSAVNQDGRSSGLTVPNGLAQAAVVRTALANAGIRPSQVSYVEAHGTGTSLGDPIEVEALGNVLGEGRSQDQPLFLSSVKTNIGHLESAAGIAGLMKVVLAMQHQEIPPHLHLQERSSRIPWPDFPTIIPTEPTPWTTQSNHRFAGVSSFGFSGTNAHVLLEEALVPELIQPGNERPAHILTLTAKSDLALRQLAAGFEQHLTTHASESWADAAFSANHGRAQFPYRLAIVAASNDQAVGQLKALAANQEAAGGTIGQIQDGNQPKIAFLFTGQGSQYTGMGRQLYETEPIFRQAMDTCEDLLRPYWNRSILEIIYPDNIETKGSSLLDQTAYTQPALFALEYALAQLWQSWGIRPSAVMGHSVGEYVAACIAGVFSLEDGLRLIAERARLMQSLPRGGKMAAVFADRSRVAAAIQSFDDQVSIASINGPQDIVISGAGAAIDAILETLSTEGISSKYLTVSHAFHSRLMEPILTEFLQFASSITYRPPQVDLISNVSGQLAGEEIASATYWQQHIRKAVLFTDSIQTLHRHGCHMFLEIGPKPTLLSMGQRCTTDRTSSVQWLPSLRPGMEDWQQLLQSLAVMYVHGVDIDWLGFERERLKSRRRLALPTYPFQRERYWVDIPKPWRARTTQMLHPLIHEAMPSPFLKDSVYVSRLAADSPAYLNDHRVFDSPLFPRAGYLEVMLAAARLALEFDDISLLDVQIQGSMILPEEKPRLMQTAVSPLQNGQATVQVFSQNENEVWQQHASAVIKPGMQPIAETDSLSVIVARCTETINPLDYYKQLKEFGLDYGPSFKGIQTIQRRDGEAIARVKLSDDIETAGYFLHPALLDACLQVIGTALPSSNDHEGVYIPAGISHFQLLRTGITDLVCHARLNFEESQTEILTGSIRLLDTEGTLLACLEGIQLKRINQLDLQQLAPKSFANLLYNVVWQPSSIATVTADLTGHWLILADQDGIGSEVAAQLQQNGATTTVVFPTDFVVLDPRAYTSLLSEATNQGARPLRGVVHLWGLSKIETEVEASQWGYGSALLLTQALLETNPRPRLWLITQGAQAVPEGTSDLVQPMQTALWGFARTLALEHNELSPVILDLEMGAESPAETILAELLSHPGENQLAWRAGKRYVARLARFQSDTNKLAIAPEAVSTLPAQATYLITGGLGGLGLALAQGLAERGARHLVLLSRNAPSADAQLKIKKLQAKGVTVLLARADVAEFADMQRVLDQIDAELPPLRGVIHAAGVLVDGSVLNQTWAQFESVMRPKILGAIYLDRLTRDKPLDFFVLFSAGAALMGSRGQINYSAANAFLDGFAHHRRAQGRNALSINWGAWAEVGLAANLNHRQQQAWASQGIGMIQPEMGVQIFEQLLNQDRVQVAVLPIDWQRWQNSKAAANDIPLLTDLLQRIPLHQTDQSKPRLTQETLLAAESEARLPLLSSYLGEQASRILGLSSSKLNLQQSLNYYGLDSLMAVELRNRIEIDLKIHIPMVEFLRGPSITELSIQTLERLDEATSNGQSKTKKVVEDDGRNRAEKLLANLDQLSNEEMDSLLSDLLTNEEK